MLHSFKLNRSYYLYIIKLNISNYYVFEGIAGDLIDILATAETVNLDELIARVETDYEVDASAQRRTAVEDFVKKLTRNRLPSDDICIKHHIFQRIGIEITYRCNERCKSCYIFDKKNPPPTN